MSDLLRRKDKNPCMCNCHRHHKPTISWGKRARSRARAYEKSLFRKSLKRGKL